MSSDLKRVSVSVGMTTPWMDAVTNLVQRSQAEVIPNTGHMTMIEAGSREQGYPGIRGSCSFTLVNGIDLVHAIKPAQVGSASLVASVHRELQGHHEAEPAQEATGSRYSQNGSVSTRMLPFENPICRPSLQELRMYDTKLASISYLAAALLLWSVAADAQQPPRANEGRIVLSGEGSVKVKPSYAQIRTGVTTRSKTVKEGANANSELMGGIIAALKTSGITEKDIQTTQFSIHPVYGSQGPRMQQLLWATASQTR